MIYTKQFLVDAYMWRFCEHNVDTLMLEHNASLHYDRVGRDAFRVSASLTAEYLQQFRGWCEQNL
jgi:hypothetical protein